ncbi:MAG TPA: phosphoribosylformylglycinamidine synthase subunit PurQ, partial [Desulfobacterales bacterium]|nr:phosphoribosylformylglycinamidine synthase subunit PurQ [Desulfobacterales bacterium]
LAAARYVPIDGGAGPAAYPDNPNGSVDGIAGVTDRTGRVFGLMPHPEAFLFPENHPTWTRGRSARLRGDGLAIFLNGVRAAAGGTRPLT